MNWVFYGYYKIQNEKKIQKSRLVYCQIEINMIY